jgi:hypothetical protein
LENQFYSDLQLEHYIDNGCLCKVCSLKRKQIFEKAKKGIIIKEKVNHKQIIEKKNNNKIPNNLMTKLINKI